MINASPIRLGAALAVTVGIGYTACAFVFWLFPEASANFMNALFHGLDFRKLQVKSTIFDFGSYAYAVAVLVAWTFGLGAILGWMLNRLGGGR